MTEEQRTLCRGLIRYPLEGRLITDEDFLRRFPSAVDGGKVALPLIEDAYAAQSAEDLGCALIVGFRFGFAPRHEDILRRLVDLDWHYSHEDVVEALDRLRSPSAAEALFRATQIIPKSLEYDDNRALAVKAIWALGKIPGSEAEIKLQILARSDNSAEGGERAIGATAYSDLSRLMCAYCRCCGRIQWIKALRGAW